MIKVLIADDHQIVHHGLKSILKEVLTIECIHDAFTGIEAISLLKSNKYDLLFLDITMPDSDPVAVIKQAKEFDPAIKIMVFSMLSEKTYALRLIEAGADGYIEKNQDKTEIQNAVKKILLGKKYISEELFFNSTEMLTGRKDVNPFNELSNNELVVVNHLIAGFTLNMIKQKMNLHASTVSTYKKRIFEKLKIKSIVELIDLAEQHQIRHA